MPEQADAPPPRTVCQLLHSLTVGGAEVLAERLARKLRGEFRFVFACLDDLGELGTALRSDGVPVHVLHRRPGLDLGCVRRLSRLLRKERVDLIHAHQYTPFFYATAARALRVRLPVMFTEHGRHQPDYPRRKRMIYNRLVLRRGDRVIGVGETVRRALIENEGIAPPRVSVIYNGIDLAAFETKNADRAAARREIGVGPDDFVIAQVARLDYLKDHATAVRTIARTAEQNRQARLVVVGDGPLRGEIEEQIARAGAGEFIRMLGLRRDVGRILAVADAFLLTSISEGIPLTVIEAMAAGLPVVSTAVGGVPEVIVEGETGLLSPAGDDQALAQALLALSADGELRARMGEAGRRRAREIFSEEQMHAGYRECYNGMLQACRRLQVVAEGNGDCVGA